MRDLKKKKCLNADPNIGVHPAGEANSVFYPKDRSPSVSILGSGDWTWEMLHTLG